MRSFVIAFIAFLLVSAPCQAAIEFDGVDDLVDTTSPVNHNIGTGDFTWSLWVYPNALASGYRGVLNNYNYTPALYARLGGSANWGLYYSGAYPSGVSLSTNQWTHILVRRFGGTVSYYSNGSQTPMTYNLSNNMPNSKIQIGVGDMNTSEFFNGRIDDVRIYNRALTASEIEVLYNAKRKRVGGSVANGMVAHYEMDGGEIGSAVSTVIDASGNSNHGTGNGGASLKFIEGVVQR